MNLASARTADGCEGRTSWGRHTLAAVAAVSVAILGAAPILAFPQFQEYSEKHSGRVVNCSMCHMNDNGPTGNDEGQLGGLNEDQLAKVNQARSAMAPGQDVDSPILNEFGNHIIKSIGMQKVLEAVADPSKLVNALGNQSDLDGDGIPDAREFSDGTDPLNNLHGDPLLLFGINAKRNWADLLRTAVAVGLVFFGLMCFLKALHLQTNGLPPSAPPEGVEKSGKE